ncbi:UPF0183 protein [Trifolium repens]|nr:UPF0183 protein [Trifolium repens]
MHRPRRKRISSPSGETVRRRIHMLENRPPLLWLRRLSPSTTSISEASRTSATQLVLKAHKEAVNSLSGNGSTKLGTVATVVTATNSTASECSEEIEAAMQISLRNALGMMPNINIDGHMDSLTIMKAKADEIAKLMNEQFKALIEDLEGLSFAFPIPREVYHHELKSFKFTSSYMLTLFLFIMKVELPLEFPDETTPVTCRVSIYDSSSGKKVGVGFLMDKASAPPLPTGSIYMEEVHVKVWFLQSLKYKLV